VPEPFHPDDIPAPRAGVDVVSLPLSAEEGFVLSRIDGSTRTRDLVSFTGLPEARVLAALARLLALGAITLSRPAPTASPRPKSPPPPAASPRVEDDEDAPLTPAEAAEDIDLPTGDRLRIKEMHQRCRRDNHYELLGVGRTATAADVKRAFLALSKEYHPDAFFRRQLGPFKAMVDDVFKQVKTAYDVLSDPARRKAYGHTVHWAEDEAELHRAAQLRSWAQDPRRQQEAKDRRLKRNPMVQRIEKSKRHVEQATSELAAGHVAAAANAVNLAMALDPVNPAIRELHDRVQATLRKEKMERLVALTEQWAVSGEQPPDPQMLPDISRQAMDLDHPDPELHLRLGRALLTAGCVAAAREPAERALKLDPSGVRPLTLMADVYEKAGMLLNAARVVERLQKLAPLPEREERLKRLRSQV
jgi:tetratricopeptide (TPR) repeat protein